jgi:hypothetical protein
VRYGQKINMEQDKCYLHVGAKEVFGEEIDLYPYVNTNKEIFITVKARSIGKSPSKLYVGFCFYDENRTPIYSSYVLRHKSQLTITDVINPSTIIATGNDVEKWRRSRDKILGIYFEGNTNELPNCTYHYTSMDLEHPTAIKIKLSNPLPNNILDNIIRGVTVLMPHYFGGKYNYCAASGVNVPMNNFRNYTGSFKCIEAFGNNNKFMRMGARYARPLFLVNYRQDNTHEVILKDIMVGMKL